MQFTLPTTKTEMLETLKEIFYYYRIQRIEFDNVDLERLSLERLVFQPLTDEQLLLKATEILASEHTKDIREKVNIHETNVKKLNEQLISLNQNALSLIDNINQEYLLAKDKIEQNASAWAITDTSLITSQLAELEGQRIEKISQIEQDLAVKRAEIEGQIVVELENKNSATEYFSKEHTQQINAKVIELKKEQEKTIRDVKKYNTTLEEREQRNANTLKEVEATLKLKFLQICSEGLTKDQLVEMGYYQDVIDCVCAYYNTLEPVQAFKDVSNETKIVTYLDDYYNQIVYMYQVKATTTV